MKGHARLPREACECVYLGYLGDICLLGVISVDLVIGVSILRLVLNVTEMFDYKCLWEINDKPLHTSLCRCLHLIQRKLNAKGEFNLFLSKTDKRYSYIIIE